MTRILDRLTPQNRTGSAFVRLWQRTCEAIESQFDNISQALASMDDLPLITLAATSAGVVDPSAQLPKNVACKRYSGSTDVTTSSAWSATTDSGSITYTIGASTGILNITAMASNEAIINVTSSYGGVSRTRKQQVRKSLAGVPSGSGGGTSASVSSFNSINAASHADISGTLTVTVGSAGVVTLTAPLGVTTAAASPAGSYDVYGIWQWDSTGGGVWTDLGTETLNTDPTVVNSEGGGAYSVADGSLSVSSSKTGLAAASTQKFRLQARNSSGTRTMYFYGTASAVGS